MSTLDETLAHFGIKGMKWGVRRSRGSDGTVGGAHPSSSASDAEKAKEFHTRARTQGTHSLSNQELQHLVNRMNLEQQYSKLNKQRSNAGAKFAKEVLVQVGKQQTAKLASDILTKSVASAIKK
jgi:hypothetical protein